MKKPILLSILILIVVLALGGFLYTREHRSGTGQTNPEAPTSTEENIIQTEMGVGGITCFQNKKYVVMEKGRDENVGNDFLVIKKVGIMDGVPCTWTEEHADFMITKEEAAYFLTLIDHFLILDSGTAPEPRGLIVYDLATGKKVFMDMYAKPTERGKDTFSYWTPSGTKATAQNCPDFEKNSTSGLGSVIETHVELDLNTLVKKDLEGERCQATQ